MNLRCIRMLALLGGLFFLNSCGGTGAGNPGSVNFAVVGINRTSALALTLESGIEINEARIVIGRIRLRPLADCVSGGSGGTAGFDAEGPFVVDLLDNTSLPAIGALNIQPATYCRIELRLDDLEEDELPQGISPSDTLVENSVEILGARVDMTPFVIRLEIDDDFKLENAIEGFPIMSGNTFFMAFNFPEWFDGVDLDSATISSGTIIIDKDNALVINAHLLRSGKIPRLR